MCETHISGDRVTPDFGTCGGPGNQGHGCEGNLLNKSEQKDGYCRNYPVCVVERVKFEEEFEQQAS